MFRILPARVLLVLGALAFLCAAPANSQFPNRQFPNPLNNGSLHMSINPHVFAAPMSTSPSVLGPAGTFIVTPGALPFSGIAAMNQDLRLVCNGIAIEPWRLVVALNGWPAASLNKIVVGTPPTVIGLGFGVDPTLAAGPGSIIGVRPWYPVDDTAYKICGWGAYRRGGQTAPIGTHTAPMAMTLGAPSGYGPIFTPSYVSAGWKPFAYVPYQGPTGFAAGFGKMPETPTQSPGESTSTPSTTSNADKPEDTSDAKKSEEKDKK